MKKNFKETPNDKKKEKEKWGDLIDIPKWSTKNELRPKQLPIRK